MVSWLRTHRLQTLAAVLCGLLLVTCSGDKMPPKINPAFSAYISAFTSGVISGESIIRIRLAEPYSGELQTDQPIDDDLFDFDPGIDGEAWWVDPRTIEFRPEERLRSGETYGARFFLEELFTVTEALETFEFQFQIIQQNLALELLGLKTYEKRNLEWYQLQGTINTADVAEDKTVNEVLQARQNGRNLQVRWEHDVNQRQHRFQIDSIQRGEDASEVEVSWNGDPIGADETKGERKVEIPALGDFRLMTTRVIQYPEQYVALVFSDPLAERQNLRGLVRMANGQAARLLVEDNEIRVYPSERQSGTVKVEINEGIENILGYKFEQGTSASVTFQDLKPAIELVGDGVILPSSNGLIFPFRAVNLSGVQVKVIQVFEDNVAQFLQVNQLDGKREMKRVGRIVHREEISLSQQAADLSQWNAFSIDLSKLMETEPGAIYRIELSFAQKHSLYPCEGEADETENELAEVADDWDSESWDETSSWDYYEDYYYDDYYYNSDYNYDDRDNPCTPSYYMITSRTREARNVLASDLGIIAKAGKNNELNIVVTDLVTTAPLSGVEIDLLNYQQQKIGSTTTDGDGRAVVALQSKPYLLVARKEKQRGYLRLDDGSALSVSKFDVSGQEVQRGLKGYLYGERGVWRPGDSLYLTFVLEDKEGVLPETHPVTLELVNPSGQTVQRLVRSNGLNGFYDFRTRTEVEAPTGYWTAKVQVGGASFSRPLRIETVKPNRLKINLDFGTERLTGAGGALSGKLAAKWLHGATARNLKADVNVTLVKGKTDFGKYQDYQFDDPTRSYSADEQTVFEGKLDAEGNANLYLDLDAGNEAPGTLKANFVTRVYEESGDFSIDRFSIPFQPYSSYVGLKTPKGDQARGMLLTDEDHKIELISLDADGNKVSRNGLRVEVFKLSWRWWWESQSGEDLAGFRSSTRTVRLLSKNVSTSGGFGETTFKVEYPDWGRYLVRVEDPRSGHSAAKVVFVDWPGWAGRGKRENPGGASMLTFGTDKKRYEVGEKVHLSIPTGGQGRALVSVENGSKVVDSYWVEATEETTLFNFEVTEAMAPNVFVNITLVQPHNLTENDLPIRLYGITPIQVENPETHLEPVLKMPDELTPGEEVSIEVEEKNGYPMTYTIAVVDEGLLDLTRFTTPDPWPHFYAREALGVKTWDLYDLVMGAYTGEVSGLLALGGDEGLGGNKNKKANRFKPMVKFLGPFELGGGRTGIHSFVMPEYIGSVRTMVVAGNGLAYGATEKATPVKKPLMVLATLPRVVGPGEQVKLPVTVFAMDKKVKKVDLKIETNNFLSPQGGSSKSISFSDIGDEVVDFDLQVANAVGIGEVTVTAKSGSETAQYKIEIDVRNPNPRVVEVIDALVEPGKTWTSDFKAPGVAGTNKLLLEVSSIPPINLGKRLKYLLQYPHGCVEQTTSSVFPQLFLADLMEVNSTLEQKITSNVNAGIARLRTFQTPDGGMAYWPGSSESNSWGSNYAGHFLLEAKNRGYNVPPSLLKKWRKYQKKAAREWSPRYRNPESDELTQAYRLYTLALSGSPEMGAMNRLKERSKLSIIAQWRLAAAYALAGQPKVANQMIENLSETTGTYTTPGSTYGSSDRDQAMILETMVLLEQRTRAKTSVDLVAKALSGKRWLSTQTTAYNLLAMAKFVGGQNTSKTIEYEYTFGDDDESIETEQPISQTEWDLDQATGGKMQVENEGDGVLYVRLVMEGIPAVGETSASENDLKMVVSYMDLQGKSIDIRQLQQGTDFMAEVIISNPGLRGDYQEMALEQVFPSGWEIRNVRMDGFENPLLQGTTTPDYQDFRDDRVYTYYKVPARQSVTFVVLLHAAYQGRFYLAPVYSESMYDNTINARKPGQWVEVLPFNPASL
ncbi:MAG: alpha-2-macroglobulin [Salibacteraceae bacterium]